MIARQRSGPAGPVGGAGVRVDGTGIWLPARDEAVFDVAFDGRRVFSFWLHRDGRAEARDGRDGHLLEWPGTLRDFLHGPTQVTLTEHPAGEVPFDEEVRFPGGRPGARVAVETPDGRPLSLDKGWRRVITFDTRSPEQVEPLMRAISDVLGALQDAGVEAFLAYGTLLGAVRDGRLIGHDSDADLGYVSRHEHPVDVVRESFRLQRRLVERGYAVQRYSGAAFKVDVREPDGSVRGLDVFGGFLAGGRLHLLGEIRVPFREEWIFPLGTATLEGWTFAVPADTDRVLTATYGKSWRVPDPAFHFETPRSTYRRLNGWFRGTSQERPLWDRMYSKRLDPPLVASDTLAWVRASEPDLGRPGSRLVDVGCGRGVDVWAAAADGISSTGLDLVPRGFEAAERITADQGLPADFLALNLLDVRSVVVDGALVAARRGAAGPPVLMARHLVDAVNERGRVELARLAAMLLRGAGGDGGRCYLQFLVEPGDDGLADRLRVQPRSPDTVLATLAAAGGRELRREVLDATVLAGLDALGRRLPSPRGTRPSRICRMVVGWDR